MITKNHPSAYAELFKKAQAALAAHGSDEAFKSAVISNIDDYFACLAELARIEELTDENDNLLYDPIFTILPATEETFNIDANKRTIAIPENFARYGVGVQGDEIAEILYFSIDRYFDAMDLADMDIIVQWKHEKDSELANNLSATYKKSLTLQPGKIVFGWPITAEITERSGNIQFSIRFYRRNKETKTLEYSFSTLTATIKIQTGLDFELDETAFLPINKNNQIYRNLRNSKRADVGYLIAAPVFSEYYVQDGEDFIPAAENLTYDLPVTFVAKAEIPKNKPEGSYVSGSGLSYYWYAKDESAVLPSYNVYKVVENLTAETYNPNEIYYVKAIEDGKEVYQPYYKDNSPYDDEGEDGTKVTLYTRLSALTPNAPGEYNVIAKNIYVPGSEAPVSSSKWIVPAPAEPVFYRQETELLITDNEVEVVIDTSVPDNGDLSTSWYYSLTNNFKEASIIEGVNGNSYATADEGYYFVKAINKKNNAEVEAYSAPVWVRYEASMPVIVLYSNSTPLGEAISVTVSAPLHSESISYQWENELGAISGATNAEYTPTATGNYRCVVTNTYKGTRKSVSSEWISIIPVN